MKPILTIFTPTYNRSQTLRRTYQSLCSQTCKEFVWLIIDDGSKDDTKTLVRSWQKESTGFQIKYVYKENGGMHTAHNTAYENIDTELNTCIDSDDAMPSDAVEKILKRWAGVDHKKYAGIMGLDADFDGKIIGTSFPDGLTECTVSGFYARGGTGDKKLVYRTDLICSYPPYPVFEGEKYVSLAYKYLLIDQQYKMNLLNEVLCNVEYQPDGSTNTMWANYLNNTKGWRFWRSIRMKYSLTFKRKVIDCLGYCSSSQIAGAKNYVSESPNRLLACLCAPFGYVLTFYIKYKAKTGQN